MNLCAEILNSIWADEIQQCIENVYTTTRGDISDVHCWVTTFKTIYLIFFINKLKREIHMIIPVGTEKHLTEAETINDKNSQPVRKQENDLNLIRQFPKNPQLTPYLMVKD